MMGREAGFVLTHVDFQEAAAGWTSFNVNYPEAAAGQVAAPAVTPAETALALSSAPVADAVLASSQTLSDDPHPRYTILSDMDFGPDQFIRTHLLAYC